MGRGYVLNFWHYRRIPFSLHLIPLMMEDPRINLTLEMIKGPVLSNSKFFIDSEDATVKDFVIKTVTRFWFNSAVKALRSVEWGYSPNEVLYVEKDGLMQFDKLKEITHPLDALALTFQGKLIGFTVRGGANRQIKVEGMKAFWHVHGRQHNPWYGRSRLFGSFAPWNEKHCEGGYRDSRRLFIHKLAFDSGTAYYPHGETILPDGTAKDNLDLIREATDYGSTGAMTYLPKDKDGARIYEIDPAQVRELPSTFLEYGRDLDKEISEGAAVPPEVMEAEATGAFAGRRVPQQAFFSILQELVNNLISDLDEQVIRPLVIWNFGTEKQYEIVPFGLLKPADPNSMGESGDQEQPNGAGGEQFSIFNPPTPTFSEREPLSWSGHNVCYQKTKTA